MEKYTLIITNIAAIRHLKKQNFILPTDSEILMAYEDLCVYVFMNFKFPESHKDYIENALGIEKCNDLNITMIQIKQNHEKITSDFSLETPLRVIECFFSWGKPEEIDINKIIKLNFLIAKLHYLVGKTVFNEIG